MEKLPYDLTINAIGGIISATIVLWVTGRWQARAELRRQVIRLRNVLHDAETALDSQFHTVQIISKEGVDTRISTPAVESADWARWKDQTEEIKYALFEIADRLTLPRGLLESRFKVD